MKKIFNIAIFSVLFSFYIFALDRPSIDYIENFFVNLEKNITNRNTDEAVRDITNIIYNTNPVKGDNYIKEITNNAIYKKRLILGLSCLELEENAVLKLFRSESLEFDNIFTLALSMNLGGTADESGFIKFGQLTEQIMAILCSLQDQNMSESFFNDSLENLDNFIVSFMYHYPCFNFEEYLSDDFTLCSLYIAKFNSKVINYKKMQEILPKISKNYHHINDAINSNNNITDKLNNLLNNFLEVPEIVKILSEIKDEIDKLKKIASVVQVNFDVLISLELKSKINNIVLNRYQLIEDFPQLLNIIILDNEAFNSYKDKLEKDKPTEEDYNILEVANDADRNEVTKSYKRLCRKYHPDLSGEPNSDMMSKINCAYGRIKKSWNRDVDQYPNKKKKNS